MTFHYIILSWAVVGIADSDARHSLQAMRHGGEPIEDAVERYVTGYLSFWRLAFIDRNRMHECRDKRLIEQGLAKMKAYIATHPPVATLPKFYIVFLNQPQIGCDANRLSDVFCV